MNQGARLDVEVPRNAVNHDEARQLAARVILLQAVEPGRPRATGERWSGGRRREIKAGTTAVDTDVSTFADTVVSTFIKEKTATRVLYESIEDDQGTRENSSKKRPVKKHNTAIEKGITASAKEKSGVRKL